MRSVQALAASSGLISLVSAAPTPSSWWPRRHHGGHQSGINVQLGPRPYYLVNDMDDGPLKDKLQSCSENSVETTSFAISHRGAPLQFPEHTLEGYLAGMRMGAGIMECDVAFTKDRQLVCRHSQCDLATTTNIVATELGAKCTEPFVPADADAGTEATATCCTSDITLDEFLSLCGKMDASDPAAGNATEFLAGTPNYRTDLYAACGTLMTHAAWLRLVDAAGLQFTPELKTPEVEMPFEGDYTQQQYAQQLVDEYKAAGIDPGRVWAQSFLLDDVYYWLANEPAFGAQAVFLDERVDTPQGYADAVDSLAELAANGVNVVAPPIAALLALDETNSTIVKSDYAVAAREAGLDIITWSLERSGFLAEGGGYYYASVEPVINNDGDMYTVVDFLAKEVGIKGLFSDWPATVTYYANCMGL
ncbi:glycerophosphoryl diester phosphodiesterase [Lineolata rhizophorae]|uniref:glycerophosphodiester phosphodiesterase n=1 Tax=Lineolata rhizophorae TaxID=578093 RepID=A0A6A6NMN9_9PEZI|nr:glycerophosphoryl diester phosphodiesterase [Lineolata rhizophorae]